MTPQDATFFATVITSVAMFMVVFAIAKAVTGDIKKRYFNYAGKKKVESLMHDGWRIIGCDSRGYPKTLEKNNEIKVL